MNHNELLAPKDFDELADWLVRVASQFSPSELHGAIVGGLSGTMRLSANEWSLFGLAVMGAGEHLKPSDNNGTLEAIGGLAQEQLDMLASNDMTFKPFLPDDENTIEQRTEAVSLWCRGFLGGFAEAQVKRQRIGEVTGDETLPENVMEALRDMASIAQASVEGSDDEYADDEDYDDDFDRDPLAVDSDSGLAEEGEEANEHFERDYVEIVEYLRLAALTVFTEFGWIEVIDAKPAAATGQPAANKTLH